MRCREIVGVILTFLMPFRPRYSILGNLPGTELYLDTDTYKEVN